MVSQTLVYAFLVSPVPVSLPMPSDWPSVKRAFVEMSIRLDVMDVAESRYMFSKPDELSLDANIMRTRFANLAGSPPAGDVLRFPSESECEAALAFNRAVGAYYLSAMMIDTLNAEEYIAAIDDLRKRYAAWDCLLDARRDYQTTYFRRVSLRSLRERIGEELWLSGGMPLPVDVSRFMEK